MESKANWKSHCNRERDVLYARQEEARAPLETSFATNWLVVLKKEF